MNLDRTLGQAAIFWLLFVIAFLLLWLAFKKENKQKRKKKN